MAKRPKRPTRAHAKETRGEADARDMYARLRFNVRREKQILLLAKQLQRLVDRRDAELLELARDISARIDPSAADDRREGNE